MQVKARTLWGSEVYTHDSDLVAVLMHCGYVNSIAGIPKTTVAEAHVTLEYLPSAPFYPSVYRNGIRSRAWGHFEGGYSFKASDHPLTIRTIIKETKAGQGYEGIGTSSMSNLCRCLI